MNSRLQAGVLVVGIGNPLRGDDAVGRVVARRLRKRDVRLLRVLEHTGKGASLMELWKQAHTVIVIDSVSSHSPPGTIHRFDATSEPLPARMFHDSTHAFGLAEAVELSRALSQLPAQLIIYGIEAKSLAIGRELSAEVEQAVTPVINCILQEAGIRRARAGGYRRDFYRTFL